MLFRRDYNLRPMNYRDGINTSAWPSGLISSEVSEEQVRPHLVSYLVSYFKYNSRRSRFRQWIHSFWLRPVIFCCLFNLSAMQPVVMVTQ